MVGRCRRYVAGLGSGGWMWKLGMGCMHSKEGKSVDVCGLGVGNDRSR